MSDSVRVVALFKAKADQADRLGEVLAAMCGPTRAEDGCVSYDLLRNPKDPADFCFVEEWRDGAALKAHSQSAHLKQGREKMADLLAAPPEVKVYKQFA